MTDQVEEVKLRLGARWHVRHQHEWVPVSWMVSRVLGPQAKIHAMGRGLNALCGTPMQGAWQSRPHVAASLQCEHCVAFLHQHGHIR